MQAVWHIIVQAIEKTTRQSFRLQKVVAVQGGDINQTYQLQGTDISYFVKLNKVSLLTMFEAEVSGLHALQQTKTVRIPNVITVGCAKHYAFLVLEYLSLSSLKKVTQRQFGEQLAALHRQPQSSFGWHEDNYIGSNQQYNGKYSDWVTFWQQQRLIAQLELALENGYSGTLQAKGQILCELLPAFFVNYQPQPSLLHGDLWSGNYAADEQGDVVIYDPACYIGDREADIAMTELFGCLSADFYVAYNEVWPLDDGYHIRKNLYNLYHILNHVNLFGASYIQQAEMMMKRLITEVKI